MRKIFKVGRSALSGGFEELEKLAADGSPAMVALATITPEAGKVLTDWAFVPTAQLADYCRPYQLRRITEALGALTDPKRRGDLVEGQAA